MSGMGGKTFHPLGDLWEIFGRFSGIRGTADALLPSNVTAGKYIEFKGTDLLTIDLASMKVMNATTSSDLLNYYRELGYPLGVWSAN